MRKAFLIGALAAIILGIVWARYQQQEEDKAWKADMMRTIQEAASVSKS
jgi:hypothetical protein